MTAWMKVQAIELSGRETTLQLTNLLKRSMPNRVRFCRLPEESRVDFPEVSVQLLDPSEWRLTA